MILSSITDIGVKRKDNQDNYWSARLDVDGKEVGVVCLCDGMGGLDKGGLASKTVVEAVREAVSKKLSIDYLRDVIKEANDYLYNMSKKENISIGTTCTVVLLRNGVYEILHIGDSRCYHFNTLGVDSKFSILTKDHTVVEKFRSAGKVLPLDLEKKYRNTLTRCVGASSNMVLDYYTGSYEEGDTFLVCSDGFWHFLSEGDIPNLDNLEGLIKKYISLGETDNITVVSLKV